MEEGVVEGGRRWGRREAGAEEVVEVFPGLGGVCGGTAEDGGDVGGCAGGGGHEEEEGLYCLRSIKERLELKP